MADYERSGLLRTVLRVFFGSLLLLAFFLFILWRTENPRLQRLRLTVLDAVAPVLESAAGPSNALTGLLDDLESYSELQAENGRLRGEVERLRVWREIAQRYEEENGRLRALNAVKPAPRVSFVTGEVIGDAGGPFAQSLLINVGQRDGVGDGAAALDAAGLVGRVVGSGENSARLLLLTDPYSRTPVVVGADERRAILHGDNTDQPVLQYLNTEEGPKVGDPVSTSGQGGVYPRGLHIGRVVSVDAGLPRVLLAADYRRLEFVRVYRNAGATAEPPGGGLIMRAEEPAAAAQPPQEGGAAPAEGAAPTEGAANGQ